SIAGILLVLVALAARAAAQPPTTGLRGARAGVPVAVTGAAVMSIVGLGGIAFIGPVGLAVAGTWLWRGRADGRPKALLGAGTLIGVLVICALPTVLQLADTISYGKEFFDSASDEATRLGNLAGPLKVSQLGGIWLGPDFRQPVTSAPNTILLVIAALAALGFVVHAVRSRALGGGLALYVMLGVLAVGAGLATGASPWLMGKTLAIAAPTVPLLALCGAAVLAARHRAGLALVGVLVAGILVSNVYAYRDVTLAPRDRLAELQQVAEQIEGHGPTFDNQYEVYATRHFLRDGATVQPAELRGVTLPVIDGRYLIQPAWADLDAFPSTTLGPYPTVVVPRTPTESRPSSEFERVWQGEFYEVYRRSGVGTLVRHVPLGDSRAMPYCGNSQNAGPLALCPLQPVATPTCNVVQRIGREAAAAGASLVAAVRAPSVMLRGDEVRWPGDWLHDPASRVLTPMSPGVAVSEVNIPTGGRYSLWLGGIFARGFEVRVDGRKIGAVRQELGGLGGGVRIGDLDIEPGVHTFEIEYPEAGLHPGDADAGHLTLLRWFGLSPVGNEADLVSIPASGARTLCGKSLDWIDIVR
ncbi:MAG: hypothetical protein Q7T55_11770, partial [Solirubrobacteraceae bacterium]|nr:hypothetical protein [Solirubrobacteraceae bacterium]